MYKIDLEKIHSLSCESVAQRLGFVVKQHRTRCCFHDDHQPSMAFKKNKFRCWACGANGDSISLVERVLHKDFKEACRWLADEHNIILDEWTTKEVTTPLPLGEGSGVRLFDATRYLRFFEHPWLNEEARRFLFEERRIDPRVVRWCRLTSWRDRQGVPWLQTPYYNREGKLVGVQNRNLVKGALPRFRFPQGAECGIYNLPVLNRLRPGDELYITEGCSDCWAMLSAGHKAIAIPSATLLSKKDVELLSTLNAPLGPTGRLPKQELSTQFHIYPDQDVPGERLFLQLREVLPSLVRHQLPPGCKDFSEYYLSRNVTGGLP